MTEGRGSEEEGDAGVQLMADNLALKGNEAQYAMRYMRLKLGRRTSPAMRASNDGLLMPDRERRAQIERFVDGLIEDAAALRRATTRKEID
jgi:hypothetical protein